MKKYLKRSLTLALALIMVTQLVACDGKEKKEKEETKQNEIEKNEFVYVPENIAIDGNVSLRNVAMVGNSIYYIKMSLNEELKETKLCSLNIDDKKIEEISINLKENEFVYKMVAGNNDTLWVIKETEDTTCLAQINIKGELLQEFDITELIKTERASYIHKMAVDNDGNIYLTNGTSIIWVLDLEGKLNFSIQLDRSIVDMCVSKEGSVVVLQGSLNDTALKSIDLSKKTFGKTYRINSNKSGVDIIDIINTGVNTSLLMKSNSGLNTYDIKEQKAELLFKWTDCNVISNNVRNFFMLEDERIVAIITDELTNVKELIVLKQGLTSELKEKTILTLGTFQLDDKLQKYIVDFNKLNETYEIIVKEYEKDFNSYDDALVQFNLDITSGKVLDIIDVRGLRESFETYAEKGTFEDLYLYIEKDDTIKLEDYFENVLKGYEVDNKLYALTIAFGLETLFGKTSDVGERMSWTMEEFMEFANQYPADVKVFDAVGASKLNILNRFISYNVKDYINWSTGECFFNTKNFEKLLEFANRYDDQWFVDENEPSLPIKIQNGQQILGMEYINKIDDLLLYQQMCEANSTFIGYPNSEGIGTITHPKNALAISSNSVNKEGAWEFLKMLISDEIQSENNEDRFPVQKKGFDALMQEKMNSGTYIDAAGNEVMVKNTYSFGDWECNIPIVTEEDVALLEQLISSSTLIPYFPFEILNIIDEEAQPYFNGVKSSSEVAEIIQNRMQIYVNERQ